MCGIAGFWAYHGNQQNELEKMLPPMNHRGPDSQGQWHDDAHGVSLGHVRLAIVDLSPAGHQPMASHNDRFMLTFNGEIYNHLDIRQELGDSIAWKGHSDTETLLAAISQWGLETTLSKLVGMFAFAVWDRQEKTLQLARDRLGEKPLYYGWLDGAFVFASELKPLKQHSSFKQGIDRDALALYMRHNYVPNPVSIFQGIHKLEAGTVLTLNTATEKSTPAAYWSVMDAHQNAQTHAPKNDEEALAKFDALLSRSISQQMLADVPLGAFLSGGFDSSLVVAYMQKLSNQPVKTFSIGFDDSNYDEATYAREVAKHLNTDHHDMYVTGEDCLSVIPQLPTLYDEPFADSSQIPTYLVSKLAREHVTVSLSGDAADELFAGYSRYNDTINLWQKISRLPAPLRQSMSGLIKTVPVNRLNSMLNAVPALAQKLHSDKNKNAGDRLHKAADVIGSASLLDLYSNTISHFDPSDGIVLGHQETHNAAYHSLIKQDLKPTDALRLLDIHSYMQDDILCKVDRAAMGVSLETRVPLLDWRIVEFALSLPANMLHRDGKSKWLIKQLTYQHLPQAMMDRPKMGFAVPLDSWLKGPLNEWANDLLSPDTLASDGYFNVQQVQQKWQQHQSGERNWQSHLWNILMFQQWLHN